MYRYSHTPTSGRGKKYRQNSLKARALLVVIVQATHVACSNSSNIEFDEEFLDLNSLMFNKY
jgi:ribosome biogenesis protein Tsr3